MKQLQNILKYCKCMGSIWDDDLNLITFDLIIDFDANRADVKEKVLKEIQDKYPNYQFDAILDADYSD